MLNGVTHATRTVPRILMLAVLLNSAHAVSAQDGLYAPVLPGDTAFVRIVNTSETAVTVDLGPVRIGPVQTKTGSDYAPVRPGVSVVFVANTRLPVTAAPGSFRTVVISAESAMVFDDPHHDDPLRAQFRVYNLSATTIRVDAIEPSAPLFEGIPAGEAEYLTLNAVPVLVGVTRDDGTLHHEQIEFSRGDSYSLVVMDNGAFVVKAGVKRAAD